MANNKDNYRSNSEELDLIIVKLQDGNLDIDQATEAYEKGMLLIQKLEDHLKTAENKVKKIKANFDN